MTPIEYSSLHLQGAWRLLWGDATALDTFDASAAGFFRSFWAMVAAFFLTVPIFTADHGLGVAFAAETEGVMFHMPLGVYVATEILVGVLGWVVFLMLMVPVARTLGVADRYMLYVTVYNWAGLLVVLLNLPLAFAQITGLAGWDIALAIQFVLALIFLVYSWYIALTALRLSGLDAAAVVAVETLVFLVLAYPTEALYAQYGPPAL